MHFFPALRQPRIAQSMHPLWRRWARVGGATVFAGLCMAACGGGGSSTAVAATPTPATAVSPTSPTTTTTSTTTTTTTTTGAAVDVTKLPLGDGRYSQVAPAVGSVYVCYGAGMGGASSKGPWFNADGLTWNALSKISVQGSVSWTSNFLVTLGSTLGITGNGLPPNPTGTFPIASADPAYAYDRNPNSIQAAAIAWGLPASPAVAASPTCLGLGAIGVLLDGVRLFSADDGAHRDAVAWEIQDACQGHPERTGKYHHHSVTTCLSPSQKDSAGQHSPLVGYIADGFGLYGNLGEGGRALSNADLDECHGHSHVITVNGAAVNQYHYHQTREFPYTVGCFKGKPVALN